MVSLCIKTNNNSTIDYLMLHIVKINLENIVFVKKNKPGPAKKLDLRNPVLPNEIVTIHNNVLSTVKIILAFISKYVNNFSNFIHTFAQSFKKRV